MLAFKEAVLIFVIFVVKVNYYGELYFTKRVNEKEGIEKILEIGKIIRRCIKI